jgi:hypothetical protein
MLSPGSLFRDGFKIFRYFETHSVARSVDSFRAVSICVSFPSRFGGKFFGIQAPAPRLL